jgi:hypothetical protein
MGLIYKYQQGGTLEGNIPAYMKYLPKSKEEALLKQKKLREAVEYNKAVEDVYYRYNKLHNQPSKAEIGYASRYQPYQKVEKQLKESYDIKNKADAKESMEEYKRPIDDEYLKEKGLEYASYFMGPEALEITTLLKTIGKSGAKKLLPLLSKELPKTGSKSLLLPKFSLHTDSKVIAGKAAQKELNHAKKVERYGLKSDIETSPYQSKLDADKAEYNKYYDTNFFVKNPNPTNADKLSGYSEISQFNKELNALKTKAQSGSRPLLSKEDFNSNKWIADNSKKHNDYIDEINKFYADPKNIEEIEGGFEIGGDFDKFDNLFPNKKPASFNNGKYNTLSLADQQRLASVRDLDMGDLRKYKLEKSLKEAKNKDWSKDWYHKADPEDYFIEMNGGSKAKKLMENMSLEEIKAANEVTFNRLKKQAADRLSKELPYRGTTAFKNVSNNKKGGALIYKK